MQLFANVVVQIYIMLCLCILGFALYKYKMFSDKTIKHLSTFLISIVNPCLMFSAYNTELKSELLVGLFQTFIVAIVTHAIFIILSNILFKDCVEKFGFIYSNCAFIGIPIINAVAGMTGVFYLTAYITVFNLLMWSHGIIILAGKGNVNIIKNVVFSPTIIATFAGLVIFFAQIKLPYFMLQPIKYVADLNTPLAMIVSGATIVQAKILPAFKNKRIYILALLKLLVIPALLMIVLYLFKLNHNAVFVAIIACACPTASSTILLSLKYNQNSKYASHIFGITTILSCITIPILILLQGVIFK